MCTRHAPITQTRKLPLTNTHAFCKMPCTPIISYRRFGGVCPLHRRDKRSRRRANLQPMFSNVTTGRQETFVWPLWRLHTLNHTTARTTLSLLIPCRCMWQWHYIGEGSRDSSVGIETCYGLDGPGIESQWGQDFPYRPHRPRCPANLL